LVPKYAQCATHLFHGSQLFRPGGEAVAFCGVDAYCAIADDDPKVVNGGAFELTLGGFQEEALGFQKIEDIMDNLSVEGEVVISSDQNIIHIDKEHAWVFVFQGLEQVIHSLLKRRR
jgi:hypothetical protein